MIDIPFITKSALIDGGMIFLAIVVQSLPFIVLGVLISGLFRHFLSHKTLMRYLPKKPLLGCLSGSALGFFFPVCECGNIPVARRLLAQGVPLHVVMTFLLSAPVFNPIVIVSTAVAFRTLPIMVLLRVVISLSIAVIIGWLFSRVKNADAWTEAASIREKEAHQEACFHSSDGTDRFLGNAIIEFFQMMQFLILGAFIAAGIQVIVPRELLLSLGDGVISSTFSMMFLAFIVSICSTVDAFFAVSYSGQFSPLALLGFLVFGPVVDMKSLIMMRTLFKTKTILLVSTLAAVLCFLSILALNSLFSLSL